MSTLARRTWIVEVVRLGTFMLVAGLVSSVHAQLAIAVGVSRNNKCLEQKKEANSNSWNVDARATIHVFATGSSTGAPAASITAVAASRVTCVPAPPKPGEILSDGSPARILEADFAPATAGAISGTATISQDFDLHALANECVRSRSAPFQSVVITIDFTLIDANNVSKTNRVIVTGACSSNTADCLEQPPPTECGQHHSPPKTCCGENSLSCGSCELEDHCTGCTCVPRNKPGAHCPDDLAKPLPWRQRPANSGNAKPAVKNNKKP